MAPEFHVMVSPAPALSTLVSAVRRFVAVMIGSLLLAVAGLAAAMVAYVIGLHLVETRPALETNALLFFGIQLFAWPVVCTIWLWEVVKLRGGDWWSAASVVVVCFLFGIAMGACQWDHEFVLLSAVLCSDDRVGAGCESKSASTDVTVLLCNLLD